MSIEPKTLSEPVLRRLTSMEKSSLLRVLPVSLFESPDADVYVARIDGGTVGSV